MSVTIEGAGFISGVVGFRYVGTRYYTSSGTFAKADPFGDGSFDGSRMRGIRVRLVGGGGGSGGSTTTAAGGVSAGAPGGGGGYAEKFITDIAGLTASETVTLGAGGAAGTAAGAGNNGGTSSAFGVTATGGEGGAAGIAIALASQIPGTPALGGAGTGGDLNVRGDQGVSAFFTAVDRAFRGASGGSVFSGMRSAGVAGGADAGIAPSTSAIGVGALGGVSTSNTAGQVGAAGSDGIVIVDVFA
jgi:hypothetical protein